MRTMILIALACVMAGIALPCSAQVPDKVEAQMTKMMTAVENNDYDSFVEDGIPEFKTGVTPEVVEGVSKQLAARMKAGYVCIYLTEMKQSEYRVYLWKVVFKDLGDDALVKLVLRGDRVAGCWIQ
jgi:hypothetical protein